MAKRRASQTSVTLWLDPGEIAALDRLRAEESRSGLATRWMRDRLEPHLNTAPGDVAVPPPPEPAERIAQAVRNVRARGHDRSRRPSLRLNEVVRAIALRRDGLEDGEIARRLGVLELVLRREVDPVEAELSMTARKGAAERRRESIWQQSTK